MTSWKFCHTGINSQNIVKFMLFAEKVPLQQQQRKKHRAVAVVLLACGDFTPRIRLVSKCKLTVFLVFLSCFDTLYHFQFSYFAYFKFCKSVQRLEILQIHSIILLFYVAEDLFQFLWCHWYLLRQYLCYTSGENIQEHDKVLCVVSQICGIVVSDKFLLLIRHA